MNLSDWLKSIENTCEAEISCSECLDRTPALVDAELTGQVEEQAFDEIRDHLRQCKACREEYEILKHLVESEVQA